MFGGMGKSFQGLRICFFMNLKITSKNLRQVSLFHPNRIWTRYGEIRRIFQQSVPMRKNTDQKNSEYEHFSRSAYLWKQKHHFPFRANVSIYFSAWNSEKCLLKPKHLKETCNFSQIQPSAKYLCGQDFQELSLETYCKFRKCWMYVFVHNAA